MIKFLVAFLLLTSAALGQDESVFKLIGPYGQGSAVIVHRFEDNTDAYGNPLALAATAYHVLTAQDGKTLVSGPVFKAEYKDGTTSGGISHALSDTKRDLSLVWLVAPKNIPAVAIADTTQIVPAISDTFEPQGLMARFAGWGNGKFRETRGRTSFRHDGIIQSDAVLIPGQSGGAMFVDDKLAGIVCGGFQWYQNPKQTTVTWPARCADASLIPPMVARMKEFLVTSPLSLK